VSTDTLIGITGVVASLFFGILSLIFYFKAKSVRLPSFVYDHVLMQTKSHPEITISFRGEKIDNLSRSRILFLNKGKKEIRAQDKPQSGFPKVVFPNGTRILSVSISATSSPDIAFRAEKTTDTTLEIGYDYLNMDDGGIVEVLFDGTASTKSPIEYKAPLIGAEPVRSYRYVAKPNIFDLVFWVLIFSVFGLVSIVIIADFGLSLFKGVFEWKKLAMGGGFLTIVGFGLWHNVLTPYRRAVPAWAKRHFETPKGT
jgi:hypothetical protein